MKKISILGSTGSIGQQTLAIVRNHPEQFQVIGLAARTNAEVLYEQAKEFRPEVVCLYDVTLAADLSRKLAPLGIRVVTGDEGLKEVGTLKLADQIIFALVGAIGLSSIIAAIQAKKSVAIANKEPLVIAGEIIVKEAQKNGITLLPIDSEHSGLWQCMEGHARQSIKSLILTSSGGPFRDYEGSLQKVSPEQALCHPKWKMGPKITIDSATLMNKGLEVIEAANLFQVAAKKIQVLIHPEAVIHAMIEFVDGSHLAHMGITDMRLPIQYALSYPERLANHLPTLNLTQISSLHFESPDINRFPCLQLGYEASQIGGTMPTVMNAANEIAVNAFLNHKIQFTDIPVVIEKAMQGHRVQQEASLEDLYQVDAWTREYVKEFLDLQKVSV